MSGEVKMGNGFPKTHVHPHSIAKALDPQVSRLSLVVCSDVPVSRVSFYSLSSSSSPRRPDRFAVIDFLATRSTEKYATLASRDEPDSSEIRGKSQMHRVDFTMHVRIVDAIAVTFHLSVAIVMHV
ncbi:hypothetical protein HN011_009476 [Eciton burchellii]|nr:hypothetical protein HN011_009476 [Eciton burchellii]